jgi:hypothetical protein
MKVSELVRLAKAVRALGASELSYGDFRVVFTAPVPVSPLREPTPAASPDVALDAIDRELAHRHDLARDKAAQEALLYGSVE